MGLGYHRPSDTLSISSTSSMHLERSKMLASDVLFSAAGPALGFQTSAQPVAQNSTLEMRVIALETKLRHHNPEHPCDCKYELSLLEEKLGGLNEHPWERRLSEIEKKQRRDAKDVSRLWKDLRDCQDLTDSLITDHRWAQTTSDGKNGTNTGIGLTNALYLLEQAIENLKGIDKFRQEFVICLGELKTRCDEMESDIRRIQPWMIYQMVEKQENFANKIVRLNDDTKNLEDQVEELMTLKTFISRQLETISGSVDSKASELEKTIMGMTAQRLDSNTTEQGPSLEINPEQPAPRIIGRQAFYCGNSSERTIWVPPTSVGPTNIPYINSIPAILEQPKGWGDVRAEICRELEESQKVYFSSQHEETADEKDEDVGDEAIEDVPVIESLESPEKTMLLRSISVSESYKTKKRRRRRRRGRSDSMTPTIDITNDEYGVCHKVDSSQPYENDKPKLLLPDNDEKVSGSNPCCSTICTLNTSENDCGGLGTEDKDMRFLKLFRRSPSPKKSRASLRKPKPKPKPLLKRKDRPKHVRVNEMFKQGKGSSDLNVTNKPLLDVRTVSGLEVLLLG